MSDPGRRAFLSLAAMGATALLAGCTGFGARAPLTYDLRTASAVGAQALRRRSSRMVVVAEPRVIQIYDTDRVVVREAGNVLSYLPDARWSDRLAVLVQTRLVQSFEDRRVPNVVRPSDQLNPEVALILEVRAFELDAASGQAVVTLSGRLINDVSRSVIAGTLFSAQVPVSSLDAGQAVPALDAALGNVIEQVMAWTVANA